MSKFIFPAPFSGLFFATGICSFYKRPHLLFDLPGSGRLYFCFHVQHLPGCLYRQPVLAFLLVEPGQQVARIQVDRPHPHCMFNAFLRFAKPACLLVTLSQQQIQMRPVKTGCGFFQQRQCLVEIPHPLLITAVRKQKFSVISKRRVQALK